MRSDLTRLKIMAGGTVKMCNTKRTRGRSCLNLRILRCLRGLREKDDDTKVTCSRSFGSTTAVRRL